MKYIHQYVPAGENMIQLIIVPSGFDGGAGDPIGRQMMTGGGFKSLTEKLMKITTGL